MTFNNQTTKTVNLTNSCVGILQTLVLKKNISYLLHKESTIIGQVLEVFVESYWAGPITINNRTMLVDNNKIKCCIQLRQTGSVIPMGRALSQRFSLVAELQPQKEFDFATNTARIIVFVSSTGFLFYELLSNEMILEI
jgi:hypothetical protein